MPSRSQAIFTWSLLLLWFILISFGAISILNPKWLQELSHHGIEVESRDYKDYGDNSLHDGNYLLAISQYQRALEIKPDYVGAMVNLAVAYSHAGNDAHAKKILMYALQTEAVQKGVIYYNFAELLERQGKRDESIHYYRQALDFEITPDAIYRKLGILYLTAEQYEEARDAFKMALANQVDITYSYQNMLRSGIVIFKDDTTNLPIIKEQLGRNIRAEDLAPYDVEIIRLIQQRDPEVAKTHNHLGFIYAQLGDIDGAIEHFQKSLQIWPGNADAKRNLQVLYKMQEK